MDHVYTLSQLEIPSLLKQIPQPPPKLYVKGNLPKENSKVLCVVGARRYSHYGEEVCKKLISGLAGYNICIVSGLAFGIDSIAHRSALEAKLQTISFPGSGLDPSVLYPSKHRRLAEEIVYSGGGLISEFEMAQPALTWTFPQRNRLMAGISDATLVIEAQEKSGTLITSRLALDYNRDVGAVPGQINSPLAKGPNDLIADGAKIIRDSNDILEMLGFSIPVTQGSLPLTARPFYDSLGEMEKRILSLLQIEHRNRDWLIRDLNIEANHINVLIAKLEIEGFIKEEGGAIKII